MIAPIDAESFRRKFQYDPATGIFVNRIKARRWPVGRIAGGIDSEGYARVSFGGKQYRAHLLAWLWMTGEWRPDQIDHRNMNRADNRWENLRVATKSQNNANCGRRSHNTSGYKGVTFYKRDGTWLAQITINGKRKHLGYFTKAETAHLAYQAAAKKAHGEFARFE